MISSNFLMFILLCGISLSLFFGRIITLIDANEDLISSTGQDQAGIAAPSGWHKPNDRKLDYNAEDNLVWFIQITDLHISKFRDPARVQELRQFVNVSVAAISPQLVVASGDLTDGKNSDNIGSTQYEDEWMTYKDVLTKANVHNSSFWLDIRGNHDLFDVTSPESPLNFFRRYGVQGAAHPRSYLYTLRRGQRRYAFIAMDATLEPGPRRPFNFFGVVRPEELAALKEYARKATEADHVVWFGHYPTSTLVPSGQVRRLMAGSLAYLCGHLHTLGGLVNHMHTRQRGGTLELELGDWKDNRRYRVLAIDHGLLSFADVQYDDQWPLVLVTSPKSAQLALPRREPLWTMREIPHIRILAFSVHPVTSVRTRVDAAEQWLPCQHVHAALFTCQWQPQRYSQGLHNIEVLVEDAGGLTRRVEHTFSLDGTAVQFPLLARFVLMMDMSLVCQFAFAVALLCCALPPALLRILLGKVVAGARQMPRPGCAAARRWLRRLVLFSSVDRLYWPHMGVLLYLPVGPWLAGDLITGHFGVVFAWGSFVAGSFLPGLLQFAYGTVQLVMFHLPLMLATSVLVECRFDTLFRPDRPRSRVKMWSAHLVLCVVCALQLFSVWGFYRSYDWLATLLGPFRTWALLLGLRMWYSASTLPKSALRTASVALATERASAERRE